MNATVVTSMPPPYTVRKPETAIAPIVFSSPHAGRQYPQELMDLTSLKLRKLRSLEDCYIDELYAHVVKQGAPMINAIFPRAYLDLNREPFELDPKLISPSVPAYANTTTLRVKAGLGTIPRLAADGSAIYRNKIMLPDALKRIELYHKPYHAELSDLLAQANAKFGIALLLDCHSMPSSNNLQQNSITNDIVIGNRYNTSCNAKLVQMVARAFRSMGFSVALNQPYAGGYITEHHANPENNIHALQIEINRKLYLDQVTFEKSLKFNNLKKKLNLITADILEQMSNNRDLPLAAE